MKLSILSFLFLLTIQAQAESSFSSLTLTKPNQTWTGALKFVSDRTPESDNAYAKIKITPFCGPQFCEKVILLPSGVSLNFKQTIGSEETSAEVGIPIFGKLLPVPYKLDIKNSDAGLIYSALDQGKVSLSFDDKTFTLDCQNDKQCHLEFNKIDYYDVNVTDTDEGASEACRRSIKPQDQTNFTISGPEAITLKNKISKSYSLDVEITDDVRLTCYPSTGGHPSIGGVCIFLITGDSSKTRKNIVFPEEITIQRKAELEDRIFPADFQFETKSGSLNINCEDVDKKETCTVKILPTGK